MRFNRAVNKICRIEKLFLAVSLTRDFQKLIRLIHLQIYYFGLSYKNAERIVETEKCVQSKYS